MNADPLSTLLLARLFVPGEVSSATKILGFLLACIGLVTPISPQALLELQGQGTALWAEIGVLAAAVCYACHTIIARHRPEPDPIVTAAGTMLLGAAIMLRSVFGTCRRRLPAPPAKV